MSTQQFKRGDLVRIAKDLGPHMSHFESDQDAIVMYSYAEKYGGDNVDSWCLMFCDTGGEVSWYNTPHLTLIRHVGQDGIDKVKTDREAREKVETNLGWIIDNWPTIRTKVPGATMAFLMKCCGINNPWGSRGEGITYYCNAKATFGLMDPLLTDLHAAARTREEASAFHAMCDRLWEALGSEKEKKCSVPCDVQVVKQRNDLRAATDRLRVALEDAVERLEASQPPRGGATDRVLQQAKRALAEGEA